MGMRWMDGKFLRARTITVSLPHQTFDLKKVEAITANLMKELGHAGCFSGFDIRFVHDDDYRVNPATLAVQGINTHG